ncbi:hypothetical protein [Paenibacillus oleatilyticus]|uniref:hypothetical protein n=1 Tax=Paenibacillus oleatilyticus TaxID=2594886 RepID=UPI001C1F8751|nr:hypothetical protein [Paenibacillus oleatilyticus]MBU7320295.1 hypothetical protein [Paenibacillus oleatilyticus]
MKYTPEQITELLEEVQAAREVTPPGLWKRVLIARATTWLQKLTEIVQQQSVDLEKWKREALQQYPTPDAYEAACKALHKHRERADRAEASAAEAWKAYDNLKAEMEALGEQSSVLKESLSAVVDELKSTKIKLEEEQRVSLHHEREMCRLSPKLAVAVETLKEISQGERSSIALAHMAADALVRIKASQETE